MTFDDLDVVNGEFPTTDSISPDSLQMLEDAFKGNNISWFYIRTLHLQDFSAYSVFSIFQIVDVEHMFRTMAYVVVY